MLYELFWNPDPVAQVCYDLYTRYCTVGSQGALQHFYSMATSLATGQLIGLDILAQLPTCLLVVKPCLDDLVAGCRSRCASRPETYMPNVRGTLRYSRTTQRLYATVHNAGGSLALDVAWRVSVGTTTDPERHVEGRTIGLGTIDALAPGGSTRRGEGIPSDTFEFSLPWEAAEGAYNEALLVVDANQEVVESSETDNQTRLVLDWLPAPCRLRLFDPRDESIAGSITRTRLRVDVANHGDLRCKAIVDAYDGAVEEGEESLAGQVVYVEPQGSLTVEVEVPIDPHGGDPHGHARAPYTWRVRDEDLQVQDELATDAARLAGSVRGSVRDVLGRALENAVVRAGGVQTLTRKTGFFALEGIPVLGSVEVEASHGEFTATDRRDVVLSYDPTSSVRGKGLEVGGLHFVLTDAPGALVVQAIDAMTRVSLGNVEVSAVNPPARLSGRIGSTAAAAVLLGAAPGTWFVTGRKPGYAAATAETQVSSQRQSRVELELEPFDPRQDDDDLVVGPPTLEWSLELPAPLWAHASSKDGRTLVLYVAESGTAGSGRLLFLDATTGRPRSEVAVPSPKGQQRASLDTAWHGTPVGFALDEGPFGQSGPTTLRLFDSRGHMLATRVGPPRHTASVEVSPDGAWVHTWGLFDRALHEVPDPRPFDPRGHAARPQLRYRDAEIVHFTLDGGHVLAGCPKGPDSLCLLDLDGVRVASFQEVREAIAHMDTGGPSNPVDVRELRQITLLFGAKHLRRFRGARLDWEVTAEDLGQPSGWGIVVESAALSVGGQVILYALGRGAGARGRRVSFLQGAPRAPRAGVDPFAGMPQKLVGAVRHVSGNTRGLYALTVQGHTARWYRLGRYRPR